MRFSDNHFCELNRKEGSRPLFILPGIGGKTDRFRMFGNIFRNECAVIGLEMMGTQRNETPLGSISEIAEQNIRWIRMVQPRGPYRFVGHSFGSFVMYEMTQQLETAGEGIDFMMVLDQPMSALPGFPADLDKAALIGELLNISRDYYEGFRVLEAPYPNWGPALMARLGSLPFAGLVPYLSAFMKEKYPHKEPTIEYVSRLINIRLYNSSIGYQPCGEIESEVIVLNALRAREANDDETLGWSACARNLKSLVIDGNHHDIVWGNNVVKVTEYIKKRIGSNHLP